MSDVHPHDLHRHDDDGGFLHHNARALRAERSFHRAMSKLEERLAEDQEPLNIMEYIRLTNHACETYRKWQNHH